MDTAFPIEQLGVLAAYHATPRGPSAHPPILFIHGSWGGKYQFENWLRFAADHGFEAYAVDLRAHHDSAGVSSAAVSIEQYAKDVEDAVNLIGPCYLVGHSLGGLIAQLIAARNEHVKKAVFVATTPPAGILVMNGFALRLLAYLPDMLRRRPFLLSTADAAHYLFNNQAAEQIVRLTPDSSQVPLQVVLGQIRVDTIACPTLVVAGASDRSVTLSAEQQVARKYGSKFIVIEGMGHTQMVLPGWEEPITKILEWLA